MKKIILGCATVAITAPLFAASNPLFIITPNIAAQSSLYSGETGSAVYQVYNNTGQNLTDIGLANMPAGIVPNTSSVSPITNYCSNPFNLAAGASCLLKVNLNSAQLQSGVSGGPTVCYSQSKPVYCSQPLAPDRMSTTVSKYSIPQDCQSNVANFNYELAQSLDVLGSTTDAWGPAHAILPLSPSNPNLTSCPSTAGVAWQRQRVIAAAAFWIAQKLNYCHHHAPDYQTKASDRGAGGSAGRYCNPAVDSMPGSPYFGQQARWNYSGQGGETLDNWVNKSRMWYGMDCSNYTSFLYSFALGISLNGDVGFQSGQALNGSQDALSPNTQTLSDKLDGAGAAGQLVCADGTTDPGTASGTSTALNFCSGHGGYISSINSSGTRIPQSQVVTAATLSKVLQPGDLLYIAGDIQPNPTSSIVTHVIMWTGKQVGYGPNNINPALVAPDDAPCADQSIWQPTIGSWLITDSHYQGADYRVLTQCFYLNDLWGIRRVIN